MKITIDTEEGKGYFTSIWYCSSYCNNGLLWSKFASRVHDTSKGLRVGLIIVQAKCMSVGDLLLLPKIHGIAPILKDIFFELTL